MGTGERAEATDLVRQIELSQAVHLARVLQVHELDQFLAGAYATRASVVLGTERRVIDQREAECDNAFAVAPWGARG